jgi:hypothetical protein
MDHKEELLHLVAQAIDAKCRKGDMLEVFGLSERLISLASIDPRVLEMTPFWLQRPEKT